MVKCSNFKPHNLTELVKNSTTSKIDTSKDRNVGTHFMVTNEEKLRKLER